ncbi:twin-arginine translocase subunit TatC [Alkalihalobacillus sp. MEB130]|uniref:twin-arginine translocase subunit TatC n=1 Tax=Alkalihalobacillus sp. MEB130 TaxID=2976704 RepID=UPI0028DEAF52|nr:twin-arginine translocase subunit TatC [Alkalihalobacillus sp. MEB130]MDT8861947.1 twin-arginine translocase subunit TatC [Alkalihalobacillus sp. MEB130]
MQKTDTQFTEHLGELRKRLIATILFFLLAFITSFLFVTDIYQFLVRDLDGQLALLGPGDILSIYMLLAGVCAIALSIPFAAYHIWKFVKPALTTDEQKLTLGFIPGLFFLFLVGIAFGYFVLFPIVLTFLTSLAGEEFQMFFTAQKYFTFLLHLTLPFGILFEMPAVIMFLTKLGILHPDQLIKGRKVAYFLLVITSVLITPPDFISDILVIFPLLLLYEASITLSKLMARKSSLHTTLSN